MEFIRQNKLLSTFLFCDFIAIILSFLLQDPVISDSMEHIRASWLVSIGDVPYRDFFEHHHPLLWYLFAPMMKILPHNALLVLYFSRFCAFLFSIATLYIFYLLIKNFMDESKLFPFFLTLLFLTYPCVYGFSFFKPDVFGRFFYFCGLYYFFLYVKGQKTRHLFWCFLAFFISFCFLQTFAFEILPLIVPALILFYNKPVFYRDVGIALTLPLLLIAGIIYWLISADLWTPYFQMNWLLNKDMASFIYTDKSSIMPSWLIIFALFFTGMFYQLRQPQTVYYKIFCWMFVYEFILHLIIKSVLPHYLIFPLIFAAFVAAPFVNTIWQQTTAGNLVKMLKIFYLCMNFAIIYNLNNISFIQKYNEINRSPDNQIININFCWLNIYAPKLHFYAVTPYILAPVDDYLFKRFPDFDINDIIHNNDIKYIDYLEEKLIKHPLYKGRFKLSNEILRDYIKIEESLYRRKDIIDDPTK